MLGVRWCHALLALPFIDFLLFIGSHKQYEITRIPLRTSMIVLFYPYFFSSFFHYFSIDYEQSNACPSTVGTIISSPANDSHGCILRLCISCTSSVIFLKTPFPCSCISSPYHCSYQLQVLGKSR